MMLAVFAMINARASYLSGLDVISSKKVLSDQMQKYSDSLERDISKAMLISLKRALLSCINFIITNNTYLDDSNLRIEEAVFNGTLYGSDAYFMQQNTLTHWKEEIISKGGQLGFNTSFNFVSFNISMTDAFNLKIEVDYILNVSEKTNDLRIDKYVKKTEDSSIENLEDPLFPLNTYGRVRRVITKSPYPSLTYSFSGLQVNDTAIGSAVLSESSNLLYIESIQEKNKKILVTDDASIIPQATLIEFAGVVAEQNLTPSADIAFLIGVENALSSINENEKVYIDEATVKAWNLENLENLIDKGYYIESETAPSFLDRLEGKLQNTKGAGIKSVVNLEELYAGDILIKNGETLVDFLYFNTLTNAGKTIRGLKQTWFKIDEENDGVQTNAEIYGVNELI